MDVFCLILLGCHSVIVAAVVIAVDGCHRRKLAEMERIAVDLAKENARLKEEVKRDDSVSLPRVQAVAPSAAANPLQNTDVSDVRPKNAAAALAAAGHPPLLPPQ